MAAQGRDIKLSEEELLGIETLVPKYGMAVNFLNSMIVY